MSKLRSILKDHSLDCQKLFEKEKTSCTSNFVLEDGTKIKVVTHYTESFDPLDELERVYDKIVQEGKSSKEDGSMVRFKAVIEKLRK